MARKKPKSGGNQNQQGVSKRKPQNKQKSAKQNANSVDTEAVSSATSIPKSVTSESLNKQATSSNTVRPSPSLQELSTQKQSHPSEESSNEVGKFEEEKEKDIAFETDILVPSDDNIKPETVNAWKASINLKVKNGVSDKEFALRDDQSESYIPGKEAALNFSGINKVESLE